MFKVNYDRVQQLGQTFLGLKPRKDFSLQITPTVNATRESSLRAFLWASAICHSTKGGLKGYYNGIFHKGWDYLLRAFCAAVEDNEVFVSPEKVLVISAHQLKTLLTQYATNHVVDLPDLERRAEILRTCASQVNTLFEGKVANVLERANHRVAGGFGVYSQLAQLEAFNDPLKKKTSAFLMTVHFSGLWHIVDQEEVLPMIDYHRMRVLCRTGCILVNDSELLNKLVLQKPVPITVEEKLREVSAEICKLIVKQTGIPMFEFDVLLWAHARSCCRNYPICVSNELEHDSFYNYISQEYKGVCEFQAWCVGHKNDIVRGMWEPNTNTEYY